MHRLAEGYEFMCRVVLTLFIAHIAFLVHTLMGVVVVGFFPSLCTYVYVFAAFSLTTNSGDATTRQKGCLLLPALLVGNTRHLFNGVAHLRVNIRGNTAISASLNFLKHQIVSVPVNHQCARSEPAH